MNMKHIGVPASIILASSALTGCSAVKGIFKAGVWSGVIVVVLLLMVVGGAFSMFRGRSR
ncbi:hypothetical protein [Chondromyces apiculatus]|uniref:Phosphatidate cytidylyltransferase n=1 Tax=Chondromyces apiculatus DSM 436 TaxID=1192034 RepID=A0A017TD62_9BACT|nr:hypothetical protein [Chondromyces apiculatus]EYF06862.1 Hypothetical protein CAP_1559 [Chondromyces apiculatus DSM 436]